MVYTTLKMMKEAGWGVGVPILHKLLGPDKALARVKTVNKPAVPAAKGQPALGRTTGGRALGPPKKTTSTGREFSDMLAKFPFGRPIVPLQFLLKK